MRKWCMAVHERAELAKFSLHFATCGKATEHEFEYFRNQVSGHPQEKELGSSFEPYHFQYWLTEKHRK